MSAEVLQYALAFSAIAGPIIAAISAALAHGARVSASQAALAINSVERKVDGRMDELLALTRRNSEAKGMAAGIAIGAAGESSAGSSAS